MRAVMARRGGSRVAVAVAALAVCWCALALLVLCATLPVGAQARGVQIEDATPFPGRKDVRCKALDRTLATGVSRGSSQLVSTQAGALPTQGMRDHSHLGGVHAAASPAGAVMAVYHDRANAQGAEGPQYSDSSAYNVKGVYTKAFDGSLEGKETVLLSTTDDGGDACDNRAAGVAWIVGGGDTPEVRKTAVLPHFGYLTETACGIDVAMPTGVHLTATHVQLHDQSGVETTLSVYGDPLNAAQRLSVNTLSKIRSAGDTTYIVWRSTHDAQREQVYSDTAGCRNFRNSFDGVTTLNAVYSTNGGASWSDPVLVFDAEGFDEDDVCHLSIAAFDFDVSNDGRVLIVANIENYGASALASTAVYTIEGRERTWHKAEPMAVGGAFVQLARRTQAGRIRVHFNGKYADSYNVQLLSDESVLREYDVWTHGGNTVHRVGTRTATGGKDHKIATNFDSAIVGGMRLSVWTEYLDDIRNEWSSRAFMASRDLEQGEQSPKSSYLCTIEQFAAEPGPLHALSINNAGCGVVRDCSLRGHGGPTGANLLENAFVLVPSPKNTGGSNGDVARLFYASMRKGGGANGGGGTEWTYERKLYELTLTVGCRDEEAENFSEDVLVAGDRARYCEYRRVTKATSTVAEDTYVLAEHINANRGKVQSLRAATDTQVYVKFKLNAKNDDWRAVVAHLDLTVSNTDGQALVVRRHADASWAERTLTWKTRPAVTALSDGEDFPGYRQVYFKPAVGANRLDVSTLVRDAVLKGFDFLSLVITPFRNAESAGGGGGSVGTSETLIYSSEYTDRAASRPQLHLQWSYGVE